jgi:quercetin dioxygenase-like cupin family protein
MSARVSSTETVAGIVQTPGVTSHALVPPERGSELALDALSLDAGAGLDLTDDLHDSLLFIHAGSGALGGDGGEQTVGGSSSVLVQAAARGTLRAGATGLRCVRATLGAAADLHAPIGPADAVVVLDHVEPGTATGARSFQVLHGPHNGSTRGTAFVGYIPPGKAPWHYHLYDEIVWVLRGTGQLHVGEAVEPLTHGSAFRLHPREVHIVENLAPAEELVVLGIFTPAGSPSAAYLTPDVAASYAIAGCLFLLAGSTRRRKSRGTGPAGCGRRSAKTTISGTRSRAAAPSG